MSYYDDEPYEGPDGRLLSQNNHHARKAHKCDICRKDIAPGELYVRTAMIEEGEFMVMKRHQKVCEFADDPPEPMHDYPMEAPEDMGPYPEMPDYGKIVAASPV